MNPLEILSSLNALNKSLLLMEERHKAQAVTNDEIKEAIAELLSKINDLTTRVAVLEESRKAIDDRVELKMIEVVARWQQQNDAKERQRLEDEIAALKRSQISS